MADELDVVAADSPYVMTSDEIAGGYLHGHLAGATMDGARATPRQELERVIRDALTRPPCGVAFSGGRDSSMILAVALRVARREGLELPIPLTRRFSDTPSTDEDDWQEQVIQHLQVDDWVKVPIGPGRLDLVGPIAREHLTTHGVVWPPMIHADRPLLSQVPGGTLIDGEGGDEVLGSVAHRIAPVTALLRVPRPIRWRRFRQALGAVAPGPLRAARIRWRWDDEVVSWLRPEAVRELVVAPLVAEERARPLSFGRSVRRIPIRRTQARMLANRRIMAAALDVRLTSPLLDSTVVEALARDGGVFGPGGRKDAIAGIAGDLLPAAVIERRTKATFNAAYFAAYTRGVAHDWSGEGVDPEVVDVAELRRLWLTDRPPPMTWALVQAAWLGLHALEGRRQAPGPNIDQACHGTSGPGIL